jgi:hypothetical protein
MNERTLSSAKTFLMKYIFSSLWICGFGFGTLLLFFESFHAHGSNGPPEEMKWQFLAAWIGGSLFIWWGCARLKRVRTDGTVIFVSNYLEEFRIPVSEILAVSENRWINIHPVTIRLRHPSPFGSSIIFMPQSRLFSWRSHPVVGEIRELAHIEAE